MEDLFQAITERYKEKYPDLLERLKRGAERAKASREYYRQSKVARFMGDPLAARRLRELGNNEWANVMSTDQLLVPSRTHSGQEASCPRCRDVGWLERTPEELVPCSDCSPYDSVAASMAHSGIPEARRHQTLASFKGQIHPKARVALDDAKAFVSGAGWPWLILSGPPGSGKTHLARGIALELIEQGWVARYWSTVHLTAVLRSTQGANATATLTDVINQNIDEELLVLDDFGVEAVTPWVISHYEWILDKRWDSLAPTIITTNLPEQEIKEISIRIHSRMTDLKVSVWRDMVGIPDFRRSR